MQVQGGPVRGRASRVPARATRVPEKPRLLVIERDAQAVQSAGEKFSDHYEVVTARSMSRALALLREQEFDGVYVDSTQLPSIRWAGVVLQAEEILDAI